MSCLNESWNVLGIDLKALTKFTFFLSPSAVIYKTFPALLNSGFRKTELLLSNGVIIVKNRSAFHSKIFPQNFKA